MFEVLNLLRSKLCSNQLTQSKFNIIRRHQHQHYHHQSSHCRCRRHHYRRRFRCIHNQRHHLHRQYLHQFSIRHFHCRRRRRRHHHLRYHCRRYNHHHAPWQFSLHARTFKARQYGSTNLLNLLKLKHLRVQPPWSKRRYLSFMTINIE